MSINYEYYPGCTLRTKAKKLDASVKSCAKKLGINLEEVKEWQCCGGVYPMANDEIATRLSSIRILSNDTKMPLLTVCSACHHVLKRINYDMKTNDEIRNKANRYLESEKEYAGDRKVVHYLEMLRDDIGFEKVKTMVVNSLEGKKIASYYGCLLLRPSKEMAFDDPENPSIMEDFVKALKGTPVIYALRNECCGGYQCMNDKAFSLKRAKMVMDDAKAQGAEMMITACPLCMYNLKQVPDGLPVYYFSELLAYALDCKEDIHEAN